MQAYAESSPLPQMMQAALVPLGLVSTQVPVISRSTRSVKLGFFQKAAAVVMIVKFACAYSRLRGTEGGAYAQDKLNIQANAPTPILSKRSVQKGGGVFSGAYGNHERIGEEGVLHVLYYVSCYKTAIDSYTIPSFVVGSRNCVSRGGIPTLTDTLLLGWSIESLV